MKKKNIFIKLLYKIIPFRFNKKSDLYYHNLESRLFPKTQKDFQILLENKNVPVYHTEESINFRGIPFGASVSEVEKQFSNPIKIFEYKYTSCYTHRVWFFKENLMGVKIYLQIHFINNKMVFASYIFRQSDVKTMQSINLRLLQKYLGHQNTSIVLPFSISDSSGNRIDVRYGFYLMYHYTSQHPLMREVASFVEINSPQSVVVDENILDIL